MSRFLYRGILVSLLYVFLIDGVVRLETDSSNITVLRDVLPWALLVIGLIYVCASADWPGFRLPFLGLIALYIGIATVELVNPDTVSITRGVQALRPHLEFVPLFILGYAALRDSERLRWLALVFAVAAAINGVVGIIQSTLSPQQLASWGPGYHKLLVSSVGPNGQSYGGATYVTASGQNAVRPPALGGFVGFGGTLGMLALPFALALGVGSKRRYDRIIAVICLPLIIAGVFTSQTRSAVVGAVVIVAAFVVLLSVRQSARAAPAVFVGVIALGLVLTLGLSLGRYSSIAPAKLVSTFGSARGGSIGLIPRYATTYPFGAGLGTAGPGVVAAASVHAGKLDGENSYTYLIVELGLPGLLCVIALLIAAIRRGGRLVLSRVPPDARLYLAAVTAGLIGCTVESLDGGITSAPPESTFIWLAVGIIAAWSIHAPTPILRLLPRK